VTFDDLVVRARELRAQYATLEARRYGRAVLTAAYQIDLEPVFTEAMDGLETRLA